MQTEPDRRSGSDVIRVARITRVEELGVVEKIKRIGAQKKGVPLGKAKGLPQGEILIQNSSTVENVTSEVAIPSGSLSR